MQGTQMSAYLSLCPFGSSLIQLLSKSTSVFVHFQISVNTPIPVDGDMETDIAYGAYRFTQQLSELFLAELFAHL